MKFPYIQATVKIPIPSLGGGHTRPRPIIAARVVGPTGTQLIDGLLDTGSDDTVLEEWVAILIRSGPEPGNPSRYRLVGRVQPVRVKYTAVRLRITDGSQQLYEWPAVIGFTPTKCGIISCGIISLAMLDSFNSSILIFAATIAK